MEQAYFMVNESNIVDNCVMWNGNTETWTPPAGYTMFVRDATPAINWEFDGTDFVLRETGFGDIGYTWNGVTLITQESKPLAAGAEGVSN